MALSREQVIEAFLANGVVPTEKQIASLHRAMAEAGVPSEVEPLEVALVLSLSLKLTAEVLGQRSPGGWLEQRWS